MINTDIDRGGVGVQITDINKCIVGGPTEELAYRNMNFDMSMRHLCPAVFQLDNINNANNEIFIVKTAKKEYTSKTILFATGTKWKKLEVKGSKEFENKGIAYCALCDAPLFKGKEVAVVGGSDSAAKTALFLSELAKKVYITYRKGEMRCEPISLQKIK